MNPRVETIPSTLRHPVAVRFWIALAGIGVATGLGAAALTRLLEHVQSLAWHGSGTDILSSAQNVSGTRCIIILCIAGLVTGVGQVLLRRLSSANGIDTTAAIWFHAGRMPPLRTLGSAILSILVVGLGASLGREGAPKQAGAVFANWFSDWAKLSDEQRRLLVACGAGAGMAAAYGVPLGGALFALEVLRGALALRYILPALFSSMVAAATAWTILPNRPVYSSPVYKSSAMVLLVCIVCGVIAGLFSVLYVRLITRAERQKPANWGRIVAPVVGLGLLGITAARFPQLLGNGRDISQLLFTGAAAVPLAAILCLLKPLAIFVCVRTGVPGGLFTPSLTCCALLGAVICVPRIARLSRGCHPSNDHWRLRAGAWSIGVNAGAKLCHIQLSGFAGKDAHRRDRREAGIKSRNLSGLDMEPQRKPSAYLRKGVSACRICGASGTVPATHNRAIAMSCSTFVVNPGMST